MTPSPSPEAWRPNVYVVARFLDALARPDKDLTRAALQAAVGVNYDVFRRYVDFLERRGFARTTHSSRGDVVRLTAAGRAVRDELRAWIARFLGTGPFAGEGADTHRRESPNGPDSSRAWRG